MTLLPLALKSLGNRRLSVALTIATIAISVALLLGVQRLHDEARRSFASTISGTDLIVGARSGPINLLLYSIFHIGDATNNVSWNSFREIAAMPFRWAIRIAASASSAPPVTCSRTTVTAPSMRWNFPLAHRLPTCMTP